MLCEGLLIRMRFISITPIPSQLRPVSAAAPYINPSLASILPFPITAHTSFAPKHQALEPMVCPSFFFSKTLFPDIDVPPLSETFQTSFYVLFSQNRSLEFA
jgi:hypothetical protein